eukprot:292915_1
MNTFIYIVAICFKLTHTYHAFTKHHICVTSSKKEIEENLFGIYKYLFWDSEKNNSIFYQESSKIYLYPFIDNSKHQYIFGSNITTDSAYAYCDLDSTAWNLNDCAGKWIVWKDSAWVYDNLLVEPCINEMNKVLSDQNVYITGGGSEYNGIYYYHDWDLQLNGIIYYNHQLELYLFPFITHNRDFQYIIGPNRNRAESDSKAHCIIENHTKSRYIFDVEHRIRNWFISIPWPKKLETYPLETAETCQHLSTMIAVSQKNVCIHGSVSSLTNQTYKWIMFNDTSRTSVYRGDNVSIYVSETLNGDIKWVISPDNITDDTPVCSCNISDSTRLSSCILWNCGFDSEWDNKITVSNNCNDVYVTGSYRETMNGIYMFRFWDNASNTSVYYCPSCNFYNGTYLYGHTYAGSTVQYHWVISSNGYLRDDVVCHCKVGENLGRFYEFNLEICSGRWRTVTDSDTWSWKPNEHMKVVKHGYNTIPKQTYHTSVQIIGSQNEKHNGLYQSVLWNHNIKGVVYYNELSQLYLFPYI